MKTPIIVILTVTGFLILVMISSTAGMPGMYGSPVTLQHWSVSSISYRTTPSQVERMTRIFRIMQRSLRFNPRWDVDCTRLTATVAREMLRRQQAIFQRMQQIRQTQLEINDMIMESYNRRNESQDRIFHNYSQAIRGVEDYADPVNSMTVELPYGYDNAWVSGDTYIVSENPNYNPNRGSHRNWQRLERRR